MICDFVVAAEFDIDTGATVKQQFPHKLPIDEQWIAEFMLPDGAHNRVKDWTMFLTSGLLGASISRCYCYLYKLEGTKWALIEQKPVEACWEHERIAFKLNSVVSILTFQKDVYHWQLKSGHVLKVDNCIYGVVLTKYEHEHLFLDILFRVKVKHLDPFELVGVYSLPNSAPFNPLMHELYCVNCVKTRHDKSVRRGAVVKAMAVCSRYKWVDALKPFIEYALELYFDESNAEYISRVYDSINGMNFDIPCLSPLENRIMRRFTNVELIKDRLQDTGFLADVVEGVVYVKKNIIFESSSVAVYIPFLWQPSEISLFSFKSLVSLLTKASVAPHSMAPKNTPPLIVLFNALLANKRIMILGTDQTAEYICYLVLAVAWMSNADLNRAYSRRIYPLLSLMHVDAIVKAPLFIAGVANRIFKDRKEWWDVLIDVQTAEILFSDASLQENSGRGSSVSSILKPRPSIDYMCPTMADDDVELVAKLAFFAQKSDSEYQLRRIWEDYFARFARIASEVDAPDNESLMNLLSKYGYPRSYEPFFSDPAARVKEIANNSMRGGLWRKTTAYRIYCKERLQEWKLRKLHSLDLQNLSISLRLHQNFPELRIVKIFDHLADSVHSPRAYLEFFGEFTEDKGGLHTVAVFIFHSNKSVRENVVRLLERLREHEVGKYLLEILNNFVRVAFIRQQGLLREAESN